MSETNRNILVIENDTRTLDLISDVLEKVGFSVFTATSAEVGHSMAGKLNPALILLNLATPGTGGLEICKKMQKDEALRDIPIILLTLRDGKFDPAYTKFYGIVGFLKKPFDSNGLIDAIKAHMSLEEVVRGEGEITASELARELGPYPGEEEEAPAWDAPPGEFVIAGQHELEAEDEPAGEAAEGIFEGISIEDMEDVEEEAPEDISFEITEEEDISEGISDESAEGEDITAGISILREADAAEEESEDEEEREEEEDIHFEPRIYDREPSDESPGALVAVEAKGAETHPGQEEDLEADEAFSEEVASPAEGREFEDVLKEEVEETPFGGAVSGEDIDEIRSREEKAQKRTHKKMLLGAAIFVLAVAVGFASLSYFTSGKDKYASSQTARKAAPPAETDEKAEPSFDIKVGPEEKSIPAPAETETAAAPAEELAQESPPSPPTPEVITPESLRLPAAPKQPPVAKPKAKQPTPVYYVQFGLFKSLSNAKAMAKDLSDKGFDTFIEKGTLKGGDASYRLLLNEKFSASHLARSRGRDIKGATGLDYVLYAEGR